MDYSFHALLVIGTGTDRTYLTWSYRSGWFEPVTLQARSDLRVDDRVKCKPYFPCRTIFHEENVDKDTTVS